MNTRTDEFGGDVEGRLRFCKEIIDAIHESCGDDYPDDVVIHMNTPVTMDLLSTLDFDEIIIATGATARTLRGIPALKKPALSMRSTLCAAERKSDRR